MQESIGSSPRAMYRPRNTEDLCSKCTESSRTCGQPRDTVQRVSISRVFAMLRADDIAHGVGTGRTRQNRMSTIVVTQEQLRGARVAAQTRARRTRRRAPASCFRYIRRRGSPRRRPFPGCTSGSHQSSSRYIAASGAKAGASGDVDRWCPRRSVASGAPVLGDRPRRRRRSRAAQLALWKSPRSPG